MNAVEFPPEKRWYWLFSFQIEDIDGNLEAPFFCGKAGLDLPFPAQSENQSGQCQQSKAEEFLPPKKEVPSHPSLKLLTPQAFQVPGCKCGVYQCPKKDVVCCDHVDFK